MSVSSSLNSKVKLRKPAVAARAGFKSLDVAAVAVFLMVLSAMSWRLYQHRPEPGPASTRLWALASFRDTVYYPALAVAAGVNPYDVVRNDDPQRYMQRFPVTDYFPLYSPLILLAFAPFALLPAAASMVAFAMLNVVLFVLLSWLTMRAIGRPATIANVFGLAVCLLASQPGRGVFYSGQVVLPLTLAAFGALEWGDRRGWRSAALLAFSTIKPTFGGPLGLLLAARRDWRSALAGMAAGGAFGIVGLLAIFHRSGTRSFEQGIQILVGNQAYFQQDPLVVPQSNKGRIDLVTAAEYLMDGSFPSWVAPLAALLVLGLTAGVLWRARLSGHDKSSISTASAAIILAMYVCIYHNAYDLLLLVVPIAACATAAHASWRRMSRNVRRVTLGLMLLPFVNFLWTDSARPVIERLISDGAQNGGDLLVGMYRLTHAANGLSLAVAWGILLVSIECGRKTSAFESTVNEEVVLPLRSAAALLT